MNNNRKVLIILIIFVLIFTIIGGTLAYFNWETATNQRTNVTFTANSDFSCSADGGGNIINADTLVAPTTCTNTSHAIKRTVKVTPTISTTGKTIYMDLWLDVNELGSGLSESENFMYALTTENTSCSDGVVASGNFNGIIAGGKVNLLEEKEYTSSETDTYYLWIWLDSAETSTATMDQPFDLSLNGSCVDAKIYKDEILNGADPVLTDGLIPVTIADDGTVTTASIYEEWYNYTDKEWANAILVKESGTNTRIYYQSNIGVTVSSSDILAYFVWIPRYKYQIWTTGTSSAGNEKPINIVFEGKNTTESTGTAVGEYRTHPAFIFGSEKLAGIWVGKFETSTDTSSTCYTSASSDNCDNASQEPRILPNVRSLRYQTVSNQFQTALKFSGGTMTDGTVTFAGSSTYGLSSTVDSHMMKNSEWGAVAYLSHSIYGINQEIYINNSSSYYTGRSGGNVGGSVATLAEQFPDSSTSTNQYNAYGYYTWLGQEISSSGTIGTYASDTTFGTKASTTGNVTGVYDMSGGAWERVMGNYNDTVGSSGFSTYPASKYYDKYTATTKTTACSGGVCYGHGLSETSNWYSDFAYFVSSSSPWFIRGGSFVNGSGAGAFDFYYTAGGARAESGFHAVLVTR